MLKTKFEVRGVQDEQPPVTILYLNKMGDGSIRLIAKQPDVGTVGILDITPDGEINLLMSINGKHDRLGFRTHCSGAVCVRNGRWTTY